MDLIAQQSIDSEVWEIPTVSWISCEEFAAVALSFYVDNHKLVSFEEYLLAQWSSAQQIFASATATTRITCLKCASGRLFTDVLDAAAPVCFFEKSLKLLTLQQNGNEIGAHSCEPFLGNGAMQLVLRGIWSSLQEAATGNSSISMPPRRKYSVHEEQRLSSDHIIVRKGHAIRTVIIFNLILACIRHGALSLENYNAVQQVLRISRHPALNRVTPTLSIRDVQKKLAFLPFENDCSKSDEDYSEMFCVALLRCACMLKEWKVYCFTLQYLPTELVAESICDERNARHAFFKLIKELARILDECGGPTIAQNIHQILVRADKGFYATLAKAVVSDIAQISSIIYQLWSASPKFQARLTESKHAIIHLHSFIGAIIPMLQTSQYYEELRGIFTIISRAVPDFSEPPTKLSVQTIQT